MMVGSSSVESRIRILIERMYSHIDALFEMIQEMLKSGEDVSGEFYERLLAVEELRMYITRDTLLYIARWQPLGNDLTKAEGFIKAAYDLYRISRYLREIVKLNNIAGPLSNLQLNIEVLEKSRNMVKFAVRSILSSDSSMPQLVEQTDKDIDAYYEASLRELAKEYVPREKAIEALFARHVERIADHATYLAKIPNLN